MWFEPPKKYQTHIPKKLVKISQNSKETLNKRFELQNTVSPCFVHLMLFQKDKNLRIYNNNKLC